MPRGFSPKFRTGLDKKRLESGGGGYDKDKRVQIAESETVAVQFLQSPKQFLEYEIHNWNDGKRWYFVPCADDDCPLCADDDRDIARTRYRFAVNVYDFRDRKVKVLEGGKDMGTRIYSRWERNEEKFLRRVFEITRLKTTPVSYEVVPDNDARTVDTKNLKLFDLREHVIEEMKRYYKDDMPQTALDDDEDLSEEQEEPPRVAAKKPAKKVVRRRR